MNLTTVNYDSVIELTQEDIWQHSTNCCYTYGRTLGLPAYIGDSAYDQPLRQLYDKFMDHIKGLSSLGIGTAQYGSILVPVLMSKLPDEVCWESRDEIWKINCLMGTILKKLEVRYASKGSRILTPKPVVLPRNSYNGNGSTASSLITNSHNIKINEFTVVKFITQLYVRK